MINAVSQVLRSVSHAIKGSCPDRVIWKITVAPTPVQPTSATALVLTVQYIRFSPLRKTHAQGSRRDQKSRDLRGGRWSWTLNQGGGAGLSKLDVFCFELSKLFVNSGATDIVLVTLSSTAVETAIAQCTSRWAIARGHHLNTSLFWRRSTVSPVFFGRFPRSSLSLSRPLPTLSPSLIGHLASVDVKQHKTKRKTAGTPKREHLDRYLKQKQAHG